MTLWDYVDNWWRVCVCVCDRLIYWSDWGRTPAIKRANMDNGLQIRSLISSRLYWPNALAIDFQGTSDHFRPPAAFENWRLPDKDAVVLRAWRLSSRTWNPITSPRMKQLMWLRIVHSGDWCLRLALLTPSGACYRKEGERKNKEAFDLLNMFTLDSLVQTNIRCSRIFQIPSNAHTSFVTEWLIYSTCLEWFLTETWRMDSGIERAIFIYLPITCDLLSGSFFDWWQRERCIGVTPSWVAWRRHARTAAQGVLSIRTPETDTSASLCRHTISTSPTGLNG